VIHLKYVFNPFNSKRAAFIENSKGNMMKLRERKRKREREKERKRKRERERERETIAAIVTMHVKAKLEEDILIQKPVM